MSELGSIRNIGIAAHIDAGKTTVTERILYLSGVTRRMGEVHDGRATMDFMKQEQERGITIAAAAISCSWRGVAINIIDTPGHVDFTLEVERSLRVLDGMVAVFCAVGGVEPQSETVWSQADLHRVPRIVFVNKMDRPGADFDGAIRDMRAVLDANAVPYQLPMARDEAFCGVVDLVEQRAFHYEGFARTEVPIPPQMEQAVGTARRQLLEALAEFDDELMGRYLDGEQISPEAIRAATRSAVGRMLIIPVLGGAAYRNCGIQLLLDAVVDYLPSPLEVGAVVGTDPDLPHKTHSRNPSPSEPFAALAFKIIHDPFVGQQTFVRIYSGTLRRGDTIWNSTRGIKERAGRILRIKANERAELDSAEAGSIVALIGLKKTTTGDTLCDPQHPLLLESIAVPRSVVSQRIFAPSQKEQERLMRALRRLALEDPSFTLHVDRETSDVVLGGMGELHLEVIVDRLRSEFGVSCAVDTPSVAYREALQRAVEVEYKHVKQTGGHGQYAHVVIAFEPNPQQQLEFSSSVRGGAVPTEYFPAIQRGIVQTMEAGVLAGYPVMGVTATLLDGSFHSVDSSDMAFRTAASQCFRQALVQGEARLLEPVMKVEIATPDEYIGEIVGYLGAHRGKVVSMRRFRKGAQKINTLMPLAEMFGFATPLRTMSSGRANFAMEFESYEPVPPATQQLIIERRRKERLSR